MLTRIIVTALLGTLTACGGQTNAPAAGSSLFLHVKGIPVEGFEGEVVLDRAEGITTIAANGAVIEIRPPVIIEYELMNGGMTSRMPGTTEEARSKPGWIHVEGGALRIEAGKLFVGDDDFGALGDGAKALITRDDVRVNGEVRGTLTMRR